jgi:aldehyde:ferredoxin oxidoreductase
LSGPLSGSGLAGIGYFSIITKGTYTNGVISTQANGNFGAYFKFSGFDGIAI